MFEDSLSSSRNLHPLPRSETLTLLWRLQGHAVVYGLYFMLCGIWFMAGPIAFVSAMYSLQKKFETRAITISGNFVYTCKKFLSIFKIGTL
jgi:hypothetical protein